MDGSCQPWQNLLRQSHSPLMEDQSEVPNQQTNDRNPESTDKETSSELCTNKVRQRRFSHADLPSGFYGGPLDDETQYAISGRHLNTLYDSAVENFNRQAGDWGTDNPALNYSQGFWNGYGAAVSGIRDSVRLYPIE